MRPKDYFSTDNYSAIAKRAKEEGIPVEIMIYKTCNKALDDIRELAKKRFGDAAKEYNNGITAPDISELEHEEKVDFVAARKEAAESGSPIDPHAWVEELGVGTRCSNVLKENFGSLADLQAADLKVVKKLKGMGKKSFKELEVALEGLEMFG